MDSKFNILKDYFGGTQGAVSTCGCSSDIKRCCDGMLDEMNNIRENYKSQKYSIEEILKDCVCNRRGHQYCLSEDAIQQAVKNLLNATVNDAVDDDNENKGSKLFINDGKIKGVSCDFEHLYHFIRKTIYPISGIGLLTVYDASKRIGHLLDTPIYPRQYVYVHAGAKKGAEKLLAKK